MMRAIHINRSVSWARKSKLLFFLLLTVFFGYHASKIQPDASFEKMIPTSHPYIENFLENRDALSALGNTVRIIVETTERDTPTQDFHATLQQLKDKDIYMTRD